MYSSKTSLLIAIFAVMIISMPMISVADQVQSSSASVLGNKDPGKSETSVGNLLADAIRKELRTEVAFITASEMKTKDQPIPAGMVTTTDFTGLICYPDDPLAVLQLKGKAIRQALERSVSIYPQPNLGFLHVSGLSFSFDPKKPSGQRITSVKINNSPINDEAPYLVAVTNSMANGALGYWKVWGQDQIKDRKQEKNIVSSLENYLKTTSKINYGALDRITIEK